MKKRTLLVSVALTVGMALLVAGLFGQPLYSAVDAAVDRLFPGQHAGADSLYTYTVETKRSGEVYVLVNVNFRDAATRERYLQANRAKAEALIANVNSAPISVTVTFAKPVPIPEFEALIKEAGFQVEQYSLEARDQQGGRVSYGAVAKYSSDGKVVDMEQLKAVLDKVNGSINGATTLVGSVLATKEGLGLLLSDPRVYIADVVAAELVEPVSRDTGASRTKIHVGVFSPYSFLSEGVR